MSEQRSSRQLKKLRDIREAARQANDMRTIERTSDMRERWLRRWSAKIDAERTK